MASQLYPCKLTHRELEARLEPGLAVLPGQVLRFEGSDGIYGQITEVSSPTDGEPGLLLRMNLLRGLPSLKPAVVTLLKPGQMTEEVVKLLPSPEQPLSLEGFEADYLRLGALTLIGGKDFVRKYHVLLALMQAVRPYQKMLVIDPLGVFESVGDLTCLVAGEQMRLGLQQVNGKRFLEVFGAQFPEGVRKPVMETVAAYWPESGPFTGFSRLLTSGMITESLLKNLILQNCASVIRNKVFAETPEQVLDLSRLAASPISALDLSHLQDPWKGYFYQEVVAQLFANPAWGLVPVLIYPENYLPDLASWVQKADERQVHLLGLSSPYVKPAVRNLANNLVTVGTTDAWTLQGELTLGLPVVIGEEPELGLLPMSTLEGETVYPPVAYPPVATGPPISVPPSVSIGQGVVAQAPEFSPETSTAPADVSLPVLPSLFLDGKTLEPEPVTLEVLEKEEGAQEEKEEETVGLPETPDLGPDAPYQFFNSWQQEEELEVAAAEAEVFLPEPVEEMEPDEGVFSDEIEIPESPAAIAPSSSLYRTPVVDLSSPAMEAIPSFLTADQLSELLNAPLSQEVPEPEPYTATEPSISGPTLPEPLNYPDADEGAIPLEMGGRSNFPQPEPAPAVNASQIKVPSEPPAMEPLPPFPAPEEFERDEFSFDIHLDQRYEASGQVGSMGSHEGLGAGVAQSLSEFDSFSQPPASPLLDFETQEMVRALSQPELVVAESPPQELFELPLPEPLPVEVPAEPVKVAVPEAGSPSGTPEMQEALDLIFPRAFEMPESASGYEAASAVEEVPVIQKKTEPMIIEGLPHFKAGDTVRHATYGLGTVQKIIPIDNSVVLNIIFENVGKRLLDPSLTDLTLVSAG